MGMFAWVMMGLAVWHFTVFLPDREWGGIVGAFIGAVLGSVIFGFIISGFSIPGQDETHLLTARLTSSAPVRRRSRRVTTSRARRGRRPLRRRSWVGR